MASFNRVVLVGNLTRDPELRYLQSGMAVSDISLAVNDRFKRDGQWVEEATYVDITLWGRTAEVANEYTSKGSMVLIEGRLKLEQWEKEGQKRSKLKVVGERMQMLDRKGGSGSGGGSGGTQQSENQSGESSFGSSSAAAPVGGPPAPPAEDDIPF